MWEELVHVSLYYIINNKIKSHKKTSKWTISTGALQSASPPGPLFYKMNANNIHIWMF